MDISWGNIENLEDYFITYLLYKEEKTVSQISKIRNIGMEKVNLDIIKAKQEIKDNSNIKEKDVIHKMLEIDKKSRISYINSLNENDLINFKKKLYERILKEKNAEDLMVLIWLVGELKDDRFLKIIHLNSSHPHGGVRRMSYSAMGKIKCSESIDYLHRGLVDAKPQVRQYASKALSKIGNEISIRKLQNLIENPNEKDYVKRSFLEAIEEIKERILI